MATLKPPTLSVGFTYAEPYFDLPLPEVCPRKPNFIDPWVIRSMPNTDILEGRYRVSKRSPAVFEYYERHTSDGLMYIVDI